jgi:hypothetical protein
LVVAWSRVILSEVNWDSVRDCVMCGLFGIVVVGGFVVISRCSVGCGLVNWSLGVVLQFNVVRRSSCCVVSLGYVALGRLSCSCVVRGRVVLGCFGVVSWSSVGSGIESWSSVGSSVVLRCLGSEVLEGLGVISWGSVCWVLRSFSGVVLWSLGVVSCGSIQNRVPVPWWCST